MLAARSSVRCAPVRARAVSRPANVRPSTTTNHPARSFHPQNAISRRPSANIYATSHPRRAAYSTAAASPAASDAASAAAAAADGVPPLSEGTFDPTRLPNEDEIGDAYETLEAEDLATHIYAATLVPAPKWDRIFAFASELPEEDRAEYTKIMTEIKESRGDTSDIENAFRTGTHLPADHPFADEINPWVGRFNDDEISEAYATTIFAENPTPSMKFAETAAEVNELLREYDEKGDEELDEIFAAEENDEDGLGEWAESLADTLAMAEGIDQNILRQTWQTAEAIKFHNTMPELFENSFMSEGEAMAQREAHWEHGKDTTAKGKPYVDATFTDAEIAFLIHIAKSNSDFATAAEVFRRNLKRSSPSLLITEMFLELGLNRDLPDEVYKGLEEVKASDQPLTANMYASAIRAASVKPDIQRILGYFAEMKAANIALDNGIWAALIYAYGRAQQLEKARGVLKEMEAEGFTPDGLIYHVLVLAEYQNGKSDAWERYKQVMAEKNIAHHPLSIAFTQAELHDSVIPKIPKKPRTLAQIEAKKSSTGAPILSATEAMNVMNLIEEKSFQRKQAHYLEVAGPYYTPLAPEWTIVGGANTQRIHVNRLILSAHRFPHHHRITPIGKLLIEGYFLDGTKATKKPKKGQKVVQLKTKAPFATNDTKSLETALKTLSAKLHHASQTGQALLHIPAFLQMLAAGRAYIFQNKPEILAFLDEAIAEDAARASQYKEMKELLIKHDGSLPKSFDPEPFLWVVNEALDTFAAEAEKADSKAPQAQASEATPAGADMYTQVLKRVAQIDPQKAAFYAESLDSWFQEEKRGYEVDPASLTVVARK